MRELRVHQEVFAPVVSTAFTLLFMKDEAQELNRVVAAAFLAAAVSIQLME
ncbi:MAG: hypothetical protein IPL52_02460 [Flavobacteriales bacterium]|nr:hypothetical protein [Flavobacteriales bacterium]